MSIWNYKILLPLAILLILLQVGLLGFYGFFDDPSPQKKDLVKDTGISDVTPKKQEELPVHHSYYKTRDYHQEAYRSASSAPVNETSRVYGGILPHHLAVKGKIAAFLSSLNPQNYKKVILIGPDHFEAGENRISLSAAKWKTPYGNISPDTAMIEKISHLSFASVDEDPFGKEHSISGLVPFIKKEFPEAEFTPVIMSRAATSGQAQRLAARIRDNSDPEKTLVLASVDFSHFLPAPVADFHDRKSRSVIENFDLDSIYDMEVDSPASIYTLLSYLKKVSAGDSELVFSTNSSRIAGDPLQPGTSHNFYYFYKGEVKSAESSPNFLFFGDMMLDRNVGKRIEKRGVDYIFEELAGKERKFFQGVDIIGANLEGAVTRNGNHYPPEQAYDFAFSPQTLRTVVDKYNFNFFNTANNHLLDQGEKGMRETKKNLSELGVVFSGCRDDTAGECSLSFSEIQGKKVAFLGFSMVYSYPDRDQILDLTRKVASSADIVIVNVHWGAEYKHNFAPRQQRWGRDLIDAGADVVIGHHPHVVQGMEVYKEKPIFYSLGNFVFDQYFSRETQRGLAVGMNINESKTSFFLFPLVSESSQVRLITEQEEYDRFRENFWDWSDLNPDLREKIYSGSFELNTR